MPNTPNIVALCDCPCDCTEVVYAGDHPRFSGWCLACQNGRHQPPDVQDPVLIAVHMSAFRQFDWTTCIGARAYVVAARPPGAKTRLRVWVRE